MAVYNLEPDEFILLQESGVKLYDVDGKHNLDEIVLTNQNLILVMSKQMNLLTRKRYLKRCPLSSIETTNGVPQIVVSKVKSAWGEGYRLQIKFDEAAVSLSFSDDDTKESSEDWAKAIRKVMVGDLSNVVEEKPAQQVPKELGDILEGAKSVAAFVVGAKEELSNTVRATSEQVKASAPQIRVPVTIKCAGCHAPLSGSKGDLATCPYCGTKQTL